MAPIRLLSLAGAFLSLTASGVYGGDINNGIENVPAAPSLPPLPALPPLDLSPEGLDKLLKDIMAVLGAPLLPNLDKPLSGLFQLLSDILKAAEGLLLPPKSEKEAHQLTDSLRKVLMQQNLIKEKLSALQALAEEGGLAPLELQSLRDIAQRLWDQYKQLEAFGLELLKQLADLLQSLFPQIKTPIPSKDAIQADQDAVSKAAKAIFPDLLK